MALQFRPRALWPLAVASLLVLASPAASAPEVGNPVSPRATAGKSATAQAGTIKLAAKKHHAKSPKQAKPSTLAKAKSKSRGKPAAAPAAKQTPSKASAVPLPSARPASGAKGAPGLAPPVAAALQPTLPKQPDAGAAIASTPSDSGAKRQAIPPPATTIITTAAIDVAAVKRAIEMVRNHKQSDANEVKKTIADPLARKLVDWVMLRSDDSGSDFAGYAAFIAANPNWPSIVTLRRKAEAMAWQERLDASKLRAFFARWSPLSAKGRFAYARALLALGDRKGAGALVREAWRYDSLSQDLEKRVTDAFGEFLAHADHKARMDRRLYEKDDTDAGLRAAQRLGGHEPAIAKARVAMLNKNASKAALDAVPAAARDDIGYKFAQLQMLRRSKQLSEAVALIRSVPRPLDKSHDLDEWWIERRVLARALLDVGDATNAYLVVRDATPPTSDNYRAEHQFLAGWIALRFLHDPAAAYAHFKHVADGIDNPIGRARGGYWMGRAAEALHRPQEARAHYQEAARYPTAYYGQIARAKAGLGELTLRPLPALSGEQRAKATRADVVRAAELLYAVDARDLAWTMMADLGDKSDDSGVLVILAELTAKYRDARGMLLLGRLALGRGYALDHAAFPTIGVPDYKPIGPPVEPAIVYSIVRQESWFNSKTISSANALGLMQVTPPTGRHIAKKFKVTFDKNRLLNDTTYNVQIGAAELGDDIRDYRGSYILAFVAYNAGRGRVKEWVSRFGDPRSPGVDPIDWVERIPFSETRNYVQRVMENVQVYRVRFGGSPRLLIEADLRRGSTAN
ncbi:MAG: transglycosylase SLT domain-containing protein [Xanthobacteraceae bacterium]